MLKKVSGKIGMIMVGATALTTPSSVSADQIALTFEDHGFTVSGAFVRMEDESYVLMTENGEMVVPVAMVSCEGTDCAVKDRAVVTGS